MAGKEERAAPPAPCPALPPVGKAGQEMSRGAAVGRTGRVEGAGGEEAGGERGRGRPHTGAGAAHAPRGGGPGAVPSPGGAGAV